MVNLWGNRWGAPAAWHPDELTRTAVRMVEERTLNPGRFYYGHFHYYVVALAAVAPVRIATKLGLLAQEAAPAATIQVARSLSGLMGALLVGLTFLIGQWLFDRRRGLLAASFLALSMGFVTVAHFATVDTAANFWYWLACAAALGYWKRGGRAWLLGAGIAAGLAVGTKFDRALVIVPLVGAYLWRGERRPGVLQGALVLLGLVFVLVNPTLLLAPFESLDGIIRDLWFNAIRFDPTRPRWHFFRYLEAGLGWPLTLLALAGLAVMGWWLLRRRRVAAVVWLLSTILPYALLMGGKYAQPWYPVLLFPGMALAAAIAVVATPARWARAGLIGVAIATSGAYTLGVVEQFERDARYAAADWMTAHVPAGSTIECIGLPPALDPMRYTVRTPRKPRLVSDDARERLERDAQYQRVRQAIASVARWTLRTGLPTRPPYQAWFDRYAIPATPPAYQAAEPAQRPDYVLFLEMEQGPAHWLQVLQAEGSGYEAVARFPFVNQWLPAWLRVQRPMFFVNQTVHLFRRLYGSEAVQASGGGAGDVEQQG